MGLYDSHVEFQNHQCSNDEIATCILGNGYIPTSCLKEILRELDDQLTDHELDMMIEEIDSDGSGTVDFDGKLLFTKIIMGF